MHMRKLPEGGQKPSHSIRGTVCGIHSEPGIFSSARIEKSHQSWGTEYSTTQKGLTNGEELVLD